LDRANVLAPLFGRAEKTGKNFPFFIKDEFNDFLKCGIPEYGVVRTYCHNCRYSRVVAFSCSGRMEQIAVIKDKEVVKKNCESHGQFTTFKPFIMVTSHELLRPSQNSNLICEILSGEKPPRAVLKIKVYIHVFKKNQIHSPAYTASYFFCS
jgi:hypothetical protein